jgi:hypothetical protein
MSLYKKCSEVKCKWHMGYGYNNWTFLNGACYLWDAEESMFCPKKLNKAKGRAGPVGGIAR